MIKITIIILIFHFSTAARARLDIVNILDHNFYLSQKNKIKVGTFDTIANFEGKNSQLNYIRNCFLLFKNGINGSTNFELLHESSDLNPDYIIDFKILKLKLRDNKKSVKKNEVSIQLTCKNAHDNSPVLNIKHSEKSTKDTHADELMYLFFDIFEKIIDFFTDANSEMSVKKSYFVDKIVYDDFIHSEVKYVIQKSINDTSINSTIQDIIESEIQQYFYKNKIPITKANPTFDSLFNALYAKDDIFFINKLNDTFEPCKTNFIIVLSNIGGIKGDLLYNSGGYSSITGYIPIIIPTPFGLFFAFVGSDDETDLSKLNYIKRVFWNICIYNIKSGELVYRNTVSIRDDECRDGAERCCGKLLMSLLRHK